MTTFKRSLSKTKKISAPTWVFGAGAALCLLSIAGLLMWQYRLTNPIAQIGPPVAGQQAIFASSALFETLRADSHEVESATQATDLAAARHKVGQKGAFIGTVTAVRSSAGNKKLVLDFAAQRETSVRAVVRPTRFSQFPDIKQLIGKKVWIYGVFAPHENRAEIELTQSSQVKTVE